MEKSKLLKILSNQFFFFLSIFGSKNKILLEEKELFFKSKIEMIWREETSHCELAKMPVIHSQLSSFCSNQVWLTVHSEQFDSQQNLFSLFSSQLLEFIMLQQKIK